MSADLEAAISAAWEDRASVTPASSAVREPVEAALELLDSGKARVAEPDGAPGPSLSCAVIVKRVDAQTRAKTGINELLRE